MPAWILFSWWRLLPGRGTLQQYAGRLHRLHEDKKVVQIYDYVDAGVRMLYRVYQKRVKGYRALGFKVEEMPPR